MAGVIGYPFTAVKWHIYCSLQQQYLFIYNLFIYVKLSLKTFQFITMCKGD